MTGYTPAAFAATVISDFERRRGVSTRSFSASATPPTVMEGRSLEHPDFADLAVGAKRIAPMVAVFLDLTNFTGRTFWDPLNEAADLAHAVLSGFVEVVHHFGGFPLGLRGDGLFAGFSPGERNLSAALALSCCGFALKAVEENVNPRLKEMGLEPVQARAGLDFGDICFIRTGSAERSEVNPIGFAANFAAKCEKAANSWEIVAGEGLRNLFDESVPFTEHPASPKTYQRNYQRQQYRFYTYSWRSFERHLSSLASSLNGTPTSLIGIH